MHGLKTGLNADKFGRWTQVHLRDYETHENVWIRVKHNAELF